MGDRHDTVTVAPFCLDVTEVTVAAYKSCVDGGACTEPNPQGATGWNQMCNWKNPGRAMHPVNCVDWGQAVAYCGSGGKRLPSEEAWEWAARNGPAGTTYPWGESAPDATLLNACGSECPPNVKTMGQDWKAMYPGDDGFPETAPVGSFPKGDNHWGVHDLAGNVWEWTSGNFDATGAARVRRGGSWVNGVASIVRSSYRDGSAPWGRYNVLGFRCAR